MPTRIEDHDAERCKSPLLTLSQSRIDDPGGLIERKEHVHRCTSSYGCCRSLRARRDPAKSNRWIACIDHLDWMPHRSAARVSAMTQETRSLVHLVGSFPCRNAQE